MRRTPALIVGGGPAGSAAAIMLAQAGAKPLLLERTRETPDALCGGFLSWRTLETLAALGIGAEALGSPPIHRVRLFAGHRVAQTPLPRPARAVSRRHLDTLLLRHAITHGTGVERGVAVRSIIDRDVVLADGAVLTADALLLASGKHDIRGQARPANARGADPTLGLRVRLGPAPGLSRLVDGAIELHLFDRGYAGLVLQEDGSANLCMAVHRSRLDAAGSPVALIRAIGAANPILGERLAWWNPSATIDAVANVPYGWRATTGQAGLFRLGDQAACIPSLAGEGMGIALASGMRAAGMLARNGPDGAVAFQQRLARDLRRPVDLATLIWRAAERPASAAAMTWVAAHVPALVDAVARWTRVPERARPAAP